MAESIIFCADSHCSVHILSGSKISCLIEFVIVRNMDLRYETEHLSMIQTSCHIIKLALVFQRKSYKNQCLYLFCLFCNAE